MPVMDDFNFRRVGLGLAGFTLLCVGSGGLTAQGGAQQSDHSPTAVASAALTQDVLLQGKNILEQRCSTCHPSPAATRYTLPEWTGIIRRMAPKASLRPDEVAALKTFVSQAQGQLPDRAQPSPVQDTVEKAPVNGERAGPQASFHQLTRRQLEELDRFLNEPD